MITLNPVIWWVDKIQPTVIFLIFDGCCMHSSLKQREYRWDETQAYLGSSLFVLSIAERICKLSLFSFFAPSSLNLNCRCIQLCVFCKLLCLHKQYSYLTDFSLKIARGQQWRNKTLKSFRTWNFFFSIRCLMGLFGPSVWLRARSSAG